MISMMKPFYDISVEVHKKLSQTNLMSHPNFDSSDLQCPDCTVISYSRDRTHPPTWGELKLKHLSKKSIHRLLKSGMRLLWNMEDQRSLSFNTTCKVDTLIFFNIFISYLYRSQICEEIICCRGDEVRLGVRVRIFPYPENVCAVWIMFAVKYKSILWVSEQHFILLAEKRHATRIHRFINLTMKELREIRLFQKKIEHVGWRMCPGVT